MRRNRAKDTPNSGEQSSDVQDVSANRDKVSENILECSANVREHSPNINERSQMFAPEIKNKIKTEKETKNTPLPPTGGGLAKPDA